MSVPSSSSLAVASQVSSVWVYMPEVGVILACVSKVGGVFSMVTEAVSLILEPLLSVKETVHVMISEGLAMEEFKLSVAEVPSVSPVVSLIHVLFGVREPSLRSVLVAEHISVLLIPGLPGVIETVLIVGSVF